MYNAIIFDWDGTLANSKEVILSAFQTVLKAHGSIVKNFFLEKMMGIGARNMFKESFNATNLPYDKKLIDELVDKKNQIHIKMASKIKLFEGVIEFLELLNDNFKIALATMSSRIVIDEILIVKNIKHYFDLVFTLDDVIKTKPDPELFLKCVKFLKCKPEKCLVFEDSIFGVMAAKRANMSCIGVATGAYSTSDLKKLKADLVVQSFKEKEKIMKYLLSN